MKRMYIGELLTDAYPYGFRPEKRRNAVSDLFPIDMEDIKKYYLESVIIDHFLNYHNLLHLILHERKFKYVLLELKMTLLGQKIKSARSSVNLN